MAPMATSRCPPDRRHPHSVRRRARRRRRGTERCAGPLPAWTAPMASSWIIAAHTSDPAIQAIGDCTHRPLPLYRRTSGSKACRMRWNRQSRLPPIYAAARRRRPRCRGSGRISTKSGCRSPAFLSTWRRPSCAGIPRAESFAIFHLAADGTVQAVEAVNAPAEFMAGRMMIARRKQAVAAKLRDVSCSMRELAA